MGANVRFRHISDYCRQGVNLHIECCACDHRGILDAVKVRRYFFCQHWNDAIEGSGVRFYCSICRGRPGRIRPT